MNQKLFNILCCFAFFWAALNVAVFWSHTYQLAMIIFYVVMMLLLVLYLFLFRRQSLFLFKKINWRVFLFAFLAVTLLDVGGRLFPLLLHFPFDRAKLVFPWWSLWTVNILFVAPIAEEFLFRELLIPKDHQKWVVIGIVNALLFAIWHWQVVTKQGFTLNFSYWTSWVPLGQFIFTLPVVYIRAKAGSVWLCVLLHTYSNCLQMFFQK